LLLIAQQKISILTTPLTSSNLRNEAPLWRSSAFYTQPSNITFATVWFSLHNAKYRY